LDNSELMARKHALIQTTSSQGWRCVVAIAEEVARAAEVRALECDDEDKVLGLQREARASRQFLKSFLTAITNAEQVDNEEAPHDFFAEVSTD
jgi:hypothetical protein